MGSSAIYRRSALDAIGGFPLINHSEDVFTGFEMGKKGFRTQYVPSVVSKGVSPDNLDSFVAQQYRWCEGSLTMLFGRDFHVHRFDVVTGAVELLGGVPLLHRDSAERTNLAPAGHHHGLVLPRVGSPGEHALAGRRARPLVHPLSAGDDRPMAYRGDPTPDGLRIRAPVQPLSHAHPPRCRVASDREQEATSSRSR